MGTLSGPATACVLRRQCDVFGDARFERLGTISVAHLYNLRAQRRLRAPARAADQDSPPTKAVPIGVRRAPPPDGRAGFIRIDTVHQGDLDGIKGVYHINAVDCVTQWEVVASPCRRSPRRTCCRWSSKCSRSSPSHPGRSRRQRQRVHQPPRRRIAGEAAHRVHRVRPRRSNDNGLAKTKNGAVVRKCLRLRAHPATPRRALQRVLRQHLNPYLNLHRPCLFLAPH